MPFAFISFDVLMPYFAAIPESVCPDFTVCVFFAPPVEVPFLPPCFEVDLSPLYPFGV